MLICVNIPARAQDDTSATSLPSWEFTPYRLQLQLSSSDQSVPTAELEATLAVLKPLVEREWRGSWQTAWSLGGAAAAASSTEPTAEPAAEAATTPPTATSNHFDKLVEIDLQLLGTETRVEVIYHDTASNRTSEPLRQLVAKAADLPTQIAGLLRAGFAPLTRVTKYERGQAVLRIKGGKLLGISEQLTPGSVLQPLERARNDRDESAAARALKWTLLGVTRVRGGQITASGHSGLVQAGDPGENRPIDFLALPLISVHAETELTILGMSPAVAAINNDLPAEEQTQAVATVSRALVPLPGVRVTAHPFAQPTQVAWSGVTDPLGRLRLPARWDAELGAYRAQLWVLDIGAGGETLATLPCCPGAMEKLNLSLPANPQWVTVQHWLAETREMVLQIRARKMIQIARIAAAQKNKQPAEVARLQSELRLLPDAGKVMQSTPLLTLVPEGAEGTAALSVLQKRQLAALAEIRQVAAGLGGNLPADPNLPVMPQLTEPLAEGSSEY